MCQRIFALRLINEKCLSYQTPLVLSFIDYDQAFDSAGRRVLAKVLLMCGIPDKCIKGVRAMYEINAAAVKIGNEGSSWFRFKPGLLLVCVLTRFKWIILMDFILRSPAKAIGVDELKWRSKTFLDLNYAEDLSILDESLSKMNKLSEILQVHGAWIGLKINIWNSKSLRLGINENEKVMLGNEKIDRVDSFTYLLSIISKGGGCSEDIKSRIGKAHGVFSELKKVLKNRKISRRTKIGILKAIVMTVVMKHGRCVKRRKDLPDVFQRNYQQIVLCTRLTDRISNSRMYGKCSSISLCGAIMIERLRWPGYVLWMKDDRWIIGCTF